MSGQKVLVVDDDAKILKIVQHCFQKENFEVVTACDGEEAYTAAKLASPDIAIVDLMLPKLNGLDLCELLIKECDIPVIILSAKGDELDRIVGFRLGVDDYISKPFSTTELVLRVQAVLRRVGGIKRSQQTLAYGDICIDEKKRLVTIGKEAITLTSKEFELLWLFVSNPTTVFTRLQLLNRIWNSDYEGDENTVTVHIRRLREKIEKDPSHPEYIKTVWGVGYKFHI
ncbi:MAG: response regulator transcription factor [Pelosinus sp.]|nr:response regulator transcription factor [Pelosinus sp.]